MDLNNATEEATKLLPTKQAKWAVSLSIAAAVVLLSCLLWLQIDTLLSPSVSTRLAILLPSAILLLLGAYLALFFVVRAYNNKNVAVTISGVHDDKKA